MRRILSHWTHFVVICLVTFAGGAVLVPFLRNEPKAVHSFFGNLPEWIGASFILFCCALFAFASFKLFAPKLSQLRLFKTHPPSWCGFLAGLLAVLIVDVTGNLTPETYASSIWEWIFYGAGSTVLVLLALWLTQPKNDRIFPIRSRLWIQSKWTETFDNRSQVNEVQDAPTGSASNLNFTIENAASAQWELIEEWMANESLSDHDFYGHRPIANRLAGLLTDRSRSIGLVGPFGSGKSTIVNWIKSNVEAFDKSNSVLLLFSEHSCWGFKTGSASIQHMLADAVNQVQLHVDTFGVKSLPDSYRKTFSAGGKWFDSLSNLILGQTNLNEEFEQLADLMSDIGAKLVFVVDDLDRNNSSSFDVQEVLAFLHQLKQYDNISFILSAGLTNSLKIDFAKLCDHIEYLPLIGVEQAAELIVRVRDRCLNNNKFRHQNFAESFCHWDKISVLLQNERNSFWPPQAVAVLLKTPPSMRHTLGRTYAAWRKLFGEVDWDQLLVPNLSLIHI